jgi:hypothetical protein
MEHMQNCKKWFELKTWLGKNCRTDKENAILRQKKDDRESLLKQ